MHPAISAMIIATGLAGTAVASPPPSAPHGTDRVCETTTLPIYFEPGSADLTEAAGAAVEALAETLEGCAIQAVETQSDDRSSGLTGARTANAIDAALDAGIVPGQGLTVSGERFPARGSDVFDPFADRRLVLRVAAVDPGIVG